MKKIVAVLGVLMMLAGMGCAALSDYITPADIDQTAVKYAASAGVSDPNYYEGYPNVVKADKLRVDVDAAYNVKSLDLQQQIQDNDMQYSIIKKTVTNNATIGHQREEMLFGETGLLSLGAGMLGSGILAGFLGLMRKRPQDITKEEFDSALAQATGKSQEELAAKTRQLQQVVVGVDKFMTAWNEANPEVVDEFKSIMDKTQDTDTQVAVATIKKEAV